MRSKKKQNFRCSYQGSQFQEEKEVQIVIKTTNQNNGRKLY